MMAVHYEPLSPLPDGWRWDTLVMTPGYSDINVTTGEPLPTYLISRGPAGEMAVHGRLV